jgi:hypothetical protein
VSVVVFDRHYTSQPFRASVRVADGAPAQHSDATVVMELRDPDGEVVARAAAPVGTLTEGRPFELDLALPDVIPARYVARLEIHQPAFPTRVFDWPIEVPDPTLPVAAELTLSSTTALPGDRLELTVRNTGPTQLTFGMDWEIERRLDDGGWVPVPREGIVLRPGLFLEPATSRPLEVRVPRGGRPGRHRVALAIESAWAYGSVRPSVEFDVVARPGQ